MQYILTEDEFRSLRERAAKGDSAPAADTLQKLCTMIADGVPIEADGGEPWGCILTKKHEWYCDDCPAQDYCPYPHKEWSK